MNTSNLEISQPFISLQIDNYATVLLVSENLPYFVCELPLITKVEKKNLTRQEFKIMVAMCKFYACALSYFR